MDAMMAERTSTDLFAGKRIVVKVGSALLVDEARGTVHRQWLETLAQDVAALRASGKEVVLVSSGAIAVGRRHLALPKTGLTLPQKQAAAATGMVRLVHAYQEILGPYDLAVGQVLLTLDDTENRRRYINARDTLQTLLEGGAVPLINENDTVATDEIRVGDNDRLAARVAAMISADTLVLLSDIDGLYTADPKQDPAAAFIPVVRELTPEIEAMAGAAGSAHGSGGMVTKLAAARICMAAGCRMVIARGGVENPLAAIDSERPRTWFLPSATPNTARKLWIGGSLKTVGTLQVDDGALRALNRGKSLLPAGVCAVAGTFQKGAAVLIEGRAGTLIGRGLVGYSADEVRQLMGHKTDEIETILGYRGRDEIIHRDDMVITSNGRDIK
ncbi:MAG: glutamate 5-kinase [Magnetospiraceae bacterium]